MEEKNTEIDKLAAKTTKLESELQTCQANKTKLEASNDDLAKTNRDLQSAAQAAQQELSATTEAHDTELKRVKAETEAIRETFIAREQALDADRAQLTEMQATVREKIRNLQNRRNANERVETELKVAKW